MTSEWAAWIFWFLVGLFTAVIGVYGAIALVLYWRDVRDRK